MHVEKPITGAITIGDQPTEDDLRRLKGEGYVGVVNLRQPGEPEQPLSPTAEGEKVQGLGMEYLHYGVGGAPLSQQGVGRRLRFRRSPYPGGAESPRPLPEGTEGCGTRAAPAGEGPQVAAR